VGLALTAAGDLHGPPLLLGSMSGPHAREMWPASTAGLAEIARVLRSDGRLVLVDLFATGWLRPIAALGRRRDRMHTAAGLEAMLARARLVPLAWGRVVDLGRLPLVRAVVAGCS
jgi:hypothetical protein